MHYRTWFCLLSLTIVADAAGSRARAEDNQPAAAVAIAPFLDEQTIVVARFRLDRLKPTNSDDLFAGLPLGERERADVKAAFVELDETVATLRERGVGNVWMALSLADIPHGGPFLLLPGYRPSGENAEPPPLVKAMGDCVMTVSGLLCGPRATLERLEHFEGLRAPPEAALRAVQDQAIQLLLVPGEDHRRVLRELSPTLPAEWGGASGAILADGLVWAAIGIDLAPKPAIHIVIQANDPAAAARLRDGITAALKTFAGNPVVQQHLPDVEPSIRSLTPKVEDDRLVVSISSNDSLVRMAAAQLHVAAMQMREAARQNQSTNNLKQLGIAFHNFHDNYGSFPPTTSYDAAGKPLLSWRVFLLPYVGAYPLYQQFKLDEPWDSEHNKRLISKMPAAFARPGDPTAKEGKTRYLVPVHEQTTFTGNKAGVPIGDMTDGVSNTILAIEVPPEKAVIWTKPDDWPVDLEDARKGLFLVNGDSTPAVMGDGRVVTLPATIEAATLRALFTRNAADLVGEY